mmetsp:Transcript_18475/g.55735  ORF Transcript_18475/g.55735 Transcript_18475/m.55735 type:complete len:188 (+) Transcript_18475:119-682(+)
MLLGRSTPSALLAAHSRRVSSTATAPIPTNTHRCRVHKQQRQAVMTVAAAAQQGEAPDEVQFEGVHHVGFLTEDLNRSLDFYEGVLGLKTNPERPDDKLPYGGRWLWIGPEMIHLMELPNPDPMEGRPEHGGRDRHVCVGLKSVAPLEARLKAAGIPYTRSKSGRAAIFFRDPDQNTLECVETGPWR